MQAYHRAKLFAALTLGFAAAGLTGCQTWMGGMTLPSSRYLEHDHVPQYFPPDPPFPLSRELQYQEEVAGLGGPVLPPLAGPAPAPVPAPGGVVPLPGPVPVPVPPGPPR